MFKIIAAILITLYFAFQLFLSILKYKNRNAPIPEEVADVYEKDTYLKWKQYSAEKIRIDIISSCVEYVLVMVLLLTNVFAILTRSIDNPYVSAIVILSVYLLATAITGIPTSYIDTIKIEGKYGFNKSSIKTFVIDQIKYLVLSFALTIGLTCAFIAIHQGIGDYTLLLFTALVFAFMLFINFLYPFLSKFFNKFTPLEEGELRASLTAMLEKYGYHVRDIKVMDASRRTTKSNAYFTGFGKSKTIVLYDNLLKVLSTRQITAVFAHEMGHGLHKDVFVNALRSFFLIALFVVLGWLLVKFPQIHADFGFENISYGLAVILLIHAVLPIVSTFIGLLSSFLSRKAKYRADEQAVIEGYGEELIEALKILARENFADLNPPTLVVKLSYPHPTLVQRIRHIREAEAKSTVA